MGLLMRLVCTFLGCLVCCVLSVVLSVVLNVVLTCLNRVGCGVFNV